MDRDRLLYHRKHTTPPYEMRLNWSTPRLLAFVILLPVVIGSALFQMHTLSLSAMILVMLGILIFLFLLGMVIKRGVFKRWQ